MENTEQFNLFKNVILKTLKNFDIQYSNFQEFYRAENYLLFDENSKQQKFLSRNFQFTSNNKLVLIRAYGKFDRLKIDKNCMNVIGHFSKEYKEKHPKEKRKSDYAYKYIWYWFPLISRKDIIFLFLINGKVDFENNNIPRLKCVNFDSLGECLKENLLNN